MMPQVSIEDLDHTADVGIRIRGASPGEFLCEALRGVNLILVGETTWEEIREVDIVEISLSAQDPETLLVDFLNEVIFLFDSRRLLFRKLQLEAVELSGPRCVLRGVLSGEPFDPQRHELQTEIKAATFHDLVVRNERGGLSADVVFDL